MWLGIKIDYKYSGMKKVVAEIYNTTYSKTLNTLQNHYVAKGILCSH